MYNSAKAAHIVAYLALKSRARCIHMLKAIKLVYVADRESAKRYAMTMLDEPRYSLANGPVNEITYDKAKPDSNDPDWQAIFDPRKATEALRVKDGITVDDLDELSDAEIEILDDLWDQFENMSGSDMINWTHNRHNIPEWENPGRNRTAISLERLLLEVGIESPAEAASDLQDQADIKRLIAELEAA